MEIKPKMAATSEQPPKQEAQKPYSKDFLALVNDDAKLKQLLEGSCVVSLGPWDKKLAFRNWERDRRFIADAINKDGSILDYGSANGFLLRSLQEWSNHKLDPYGVDTNKEALKEAKNLFPQLKNHFLTPEEAKRAKEFPQQFDSVYWAVGDNLDFEKSEDMDWFGENLTNAKEGGRFIVGFYDTKENNYRRIKQLQNNGIKFSSILENPLGGNEVIAWIDVPEVQKTE